MKIVLPISSAMSSKRSSRRSEIKSHPQFGIKPANMPKNQLPTRGDVLSRILALRAEEMRVRGVPEHCVAVTPLIAQVADECDEMWKLASLPTLVGHLVRAKVAILWNAKEKIRKKNPKSKEDASYTVDMRQLFDIRSCSQLPVLEEDARFLEDQCTERRLYIGSLDR